MFIIVAVDKLECFTSVVFQFISLQKHSHVCGLLNALLHQHESKYLNMHICWMNLTITIAWKMCTKHRDLTDTRLHFVALASMSLTSPTHLNPYRVSMYYYNWIVLFCQQHPLLKLQDPPSTLQVIASARPVRFLIKAQQPCSLWFGWDFLDYFVPNLSGLVSKHILLISCGI